MIGTHEWPTRDLLSHRAAATPQQPALIDVDTDTDTEWTYAEFDHRVDRIAAALESDSVVDRGGRLGILMDTRPAFATLFFAAMRLGVTVAPLNVRETTDELAVKIDRLDVDALVCEADTESTAVDLGTKANAKRLPTYSVDEPTTEATDVSALSSVVDWESDGPESAGPTNTTGPTKTTATPDAATDTTPSIEPVALESDHVQLLMFTSGTSGEPKIVQVTVGNLVASATASAFRLGVAPSDRWLCCLPMYHMGGVAPVIRSTLYGTTAVIQRTFDERETACVLDEYDISGVSLVPTMCKRLLDAGWEPTDSLRFVLLGGAPASTDFLARCREAGVPAYPTYGMTETASQITTATPAQAAAHEGTVGQPLVVTDVSIVDVDGEPVPAGEAGETVVSGPTVTPGYLDETRTADAFCDRGLRTGDVGYRDEAGRLWILNRRSDRIVTGGENVDPGEVIDVLCAQPAVEAAAVVGLEDPDWGERVSALVVPADTSGSELGPDLDSDAEILESLRAHCTDNLAGFKCPKTIGVVEELPRTHSGTVDREAARERLLAVGVDVTTSQ
ncbi:o-succinylbenzoate--CoA ligase [Natrialba magadii ATCC 43099]|uniref:O-succinylbenzoate--CoA ligase n=1 Tax=Natrialba magadii (strain ATCC 43099 / DSM 3394 / CCM 3739 / CIP 104546 / IAM 13178 / JCM 8861 / NBRC 102185 / NCIMB 2190 / MS3) TaxID=547559 RepID=D3SU16_NATMM|nr:class I adenylate-forming enzyme family protein [Natrialba magadii]ADD07105.1 o-succinylbenzoate--CoA ligase [Natrialba magadii ATCC 43099]ELY28752.1 o-succinylbenzoate--CoA ligase [Natrialba magadii ATCC 43099]